MATKSRGDATAAFPTPLLRCSLSAAVEEDGGVRHPLDGQPPLVEVVDEGAQRSLCRLPPSGH